MRRVRDPDALLQAVMFDMDGLLVNTEPLWFEVQSEIMARLGGTWSHADQAKLVGGSLTNSAGYLRAKAAPVPPTPPGGAAAARHLPPGDTGPDGDHAPGGRRRSSPAGGGPAARQWPAAGRGEWPPGEITVAEWLVETMVDRIAARGAPPMPGAAELLTDVAAAGLPRAMVTSSQLPVMDAVLAHLAKDPGGQGPPGRIAPSRTGRKPQASNPRGPSGEWPPPFDVTVCAADVTHAKPHPEPYLLAASLLDADPARCVVFEDAPNGVEAAEAAGCLVVAVPGVAGIPPRDGRIVVPSLRGLSARWLRQLAASRYRSAR